MAQNTGNTTGGQVPDTMTLSTAQVSIEPVATAGAGPSDAPAISFHAFSSALDAELVYDGTYAADEDGLVGTLSGNATLYGDAVARSMTIELSRPDGDGNVSGTVSFNRGGASYEAALALTPYAEG